ncbi:Signal transducer and activator of transcription STAT family protein [Acanthamoeba castellanii str. Neff]|uniref:Signal transducer and activator of transcription STAT family protein n=1 Tax=Acanthamoeba castellanii (strain ATCC 30010 / Neff) TaxID=1257118 RepID=L8GWB9_ACACF|nr:Signal transducer and activator of transcription STAT family protein [Acanthamoeba castellanii str. Neff]ELR17222.1 Signal transducer and activator of transcription STAT family protein [Acanthamoeba castellanii str. Neff]
MEETDLDEMNPEFGNEFWKELTDDVLDTLYSQLEQPAFDTSEYYLDDDDDGMLGSTNPGGFVLPEAAHGAMAPAVQVKDEDAVARTVDPAHFQQQGQQHQHHQQAAAEPRQQARPAAAHVPLPAISQDQAKARMVIDQVQQLFATQDQHIEQIRQIQQQLVLQPQKEGVRQLQEQQWKLNQQIELELKELQGLHRSVILDPPALHQLRMLLQRLKIQQQKIELFRQELQLPTPQVLFKGKTLEDNYVLALLSGSNVNIQNISKVKAILVAEEKNWKNKKPIENDVQAMDSMKRVLTFHNIKLNVSTRMSMVYLKFAVQVTLQNGGTHTIESAGSSPIIVITNESQWCDAAGKLLLFEAFGGQTEIPWQHLANVTHTHFLKATRQDPGRPQRRLNHGEFQYIHYKFFGGQLNVTQQQAGRFWSWFGQVVQTLRFKRHIANMWFVGLIYGFITKNACTEILKNEEIGTFVIRFSENHPGLFAVAYVDDDPYERVKHYLVKPEDISSNKSLPDFLREKPQFLYVNQLDPATGELHKLPKDKVLEGYYSKRQLHGKPSNGYVLL